MWGYFRPAGVIDVRASVDAQGRLSSWEFDNYNSGTAGLQTPYVVPNQHVQFHATDSPLRQGSYRGLAATANTTRARCTWTRSRARLGVDAVAFRLAHLDDDRLRAVLTTAAEKSGWPKPSAAGPRARHRVRRREGQLHRDRRRGLEDARRLPRRAARRRLRVRRDRQSRRPAQPGRRRDRPGPRRRAVRSDRVRRRPDLERHDGRVPRAALQGRAADRDRAARSTGPAVRRRRRDADRLRRAGNRSAARAFGTVAPRLPVTLGS